MSDLKDWPEDVGRSDCQTLILITALIRVIYFSGCSGQHCVYCSLVKLSWYSLPRHHFRFVNMKRTNIYEFTNINIVLHKLCHMLQLHLPMNVYRCNFVHLLITFFTKQSQQIEQMWRSSWIREKLQQRPLDSGISLEPVSIIVRLKNRSYDVHYLSGKLSQKHHLTDRLMRDMKYSTMYAWCLVPLHVWRNTLL